MELVMHREEDTNPACCDRYDSPAIAEREPLKADLRFIAHPYTNQSSS